MKNFKTTLFSIFITTGLLASAGAVSAQTGVYRISDSSVQSLLWRIEAKTDRFKRSMNKALDRSIYDETRTEDEIFGYITRFENATDALKQKFDADERVQDEIVEVLNRAIFINRFMTSNSFNATAERDWNGLRNDLTRLSTMFNINAAWNASLISGMAIYVKPYRVTDKTVAGLFTRIEARTDRFKRQINRSLDSSTLNDTPAEDRVFAFITEFENATDRLKQRFDANESVAADVENVLVKAASVNAFMQRNEMSARSERTWTRLRTDLNTLAGYYNVGFDWEKQPVDARTLAYTVSGNKVASLLTRIESKADLFKRKMNKALDRSVLNGTQSEDMIFAEIMAFENAADRLKQRFDAKESTDNDVNSVLRQAYRIDAFMRDYRLLSSAEQQWISLRNDLNTLSRYYAIGWNWDRVFTPTAQFDAIMTGTYRIVPEMSDNVDLIVENSIKAYPVIKEMAVEKELKNRLVSPETIVFEKLGAKVAIASNLAPQVFYETGATVVTKEGPKGSPVKVTGRDVFDGVEVSYAGPEMENVLIKYLRLGDDKLRVIRRIETDHNGETLTFTTVYKKVDPVARFDAVESGIGDIKSTGSNE